jgi:hypothetical protein
LFFRLRCRLRPTRRPLRRVAVAAGMPPAVGVAADMRPGAVAAGMPAVAVILAAACMLAAAILVAAVCVPEEEARITSARHRQHPDRLRSQVRVAIDL